MEKAELEAKIAAQKAQLDAQLAIKEAEQEAAMKQQEALLLKDELGEDGMVERLKDFKDDNSVAGKSEQNMKTGPVSPAKEEDTPAKDTKFTTQKVKEWFAKVNPNEEPGKLKEDTPSPPKPTENKERVLDTTKSRFSKPALVSSLPKLHLPVFDGDPCN